MGGEPIVVVGASLAGFRAAEELRTRGHQGSITIVGDEPHRPYDRPPLSKQVLAGSRAPDSTALLPAEGSIDDLQLEWRLGTTATGLDLASGEVLLGGGDRLAYDGLVVASGATPRRLPGTDHLAGVHTLRTLDDALAVHKAIEAGPRRVVVVGAGFIGAEVAATCRGLGLEVSLVEALSVPLERALGPAVGAVMADVHRAQGVDVRLGVGVVRIEGQDHVEQVRLTDGTLLDADLVVVGIGVVPNTGWLEASGLTLDNGVVCDETCLAAPRVVACGDVARWPNPRFGELMRVEHWDNAVSMGAHAARTLLADLAGHRGEAYAPVPWFWSDQYDRKIQLAGRSAADDVLELVAGSYEERRFVVMYGRNGKLVGVLGMNMPAKVMRWRALVETGAPFDEAVASARAASTA
ncbi:MAG TPA: FAD-dependent oxidoreductase [Acidimicrobiales bacterium]|nr:FAD-dependent oxidoreductase [Acidimicrobiales bacterium]